MTGKYLLYLAWGILGGVIVGFLELYKIPQSQLVIGVGIIFSFSICLLLLKYYQISVYAFIILGSLLGILRWQNSIEPNQFQSLIGQQIERQGQVMAEPTKSSSGNQVITIQLDGFSQYVRISVFKESAVRQHDRVLVKGVLKQPENFSGFNYVNYLKSDNIYAEVSKAKIIPLSRVELGWRGYLQTIKHYITRTISRQLSADHAGLLLGMLIGDDSKLSETVKTAFQKTGLTHILVVSGFNLTILAASISVIAWMVGRRFADIVSIGFVWLFVIFVGAEASVVRAGIMISLLLTARLFGRVSYSSVTLLWAVVVMVFINPWQLFYDIGFQLSVAATYGVLQAYQLRIRFNKDGFLSEIIWPSLGAIVFTAPIVAYYFQTFSIVALPANLVIVPFVPLVMLGGVCALIPGLYNLVVPVLKIMLSMGVGIISWLGGLQFSTLQFEPHSIVVICYYCVLIFGQYLLAQRYNVDLNNIGFYDRMTKIKL